MDCYSWNICGRNGIYEKLVVVYSIPYSHDFHSNWISIGLFDPRDLRKKFQKMYSDEQAAASRFRRNEFYNGIRPLFFR